VINILKNKQNGYFLEIGANHPINMSNTFLLENTFNWTGLMVEYENFYKNMRKSNYIIDDARYIDYCALFKQYNYPNNMDYLQIDVEANNGSTLETLKKLNDNLFKDYKFRTVTFEHDVYNTNYLNTREKSREIFKDAGYIRVFDDIACDKTGRPLEDWYVYPTLIDMDLVNTIVNNNKNNYSSSWGDWMNGELYSKPTDGVIPNNDKIFIYNNIIY
jgi:hypothetical protein